MATTFWPTQEHWSVQIPLHSPHYRMPSLSQDGVVLLKPANFSVPSVEWESLEYLDWKSGGDTNFAPLASADGELDCRGFWDKGQPDKGAIFTSNAAKAPTLCNYVTSVGANFGRVRIIKLEPQDHETALRSIHRDDNNRMNPDNEGWVVRSWLELTDTFLEAYIGRYARPVGGFSDSVIPYSEGAPLVYLKKVSAFWASDTVRSIAPDTDLQNILDEMTALAQTTCYLLTLK
jgi:hypothetical protein